MPLGHRLATVWHSVPTAGSLRSVTSMGSAQRATVLRYHPGHGYVPSDGLLPLLGGRPPTFCMRLAAGATGYGLVSRSACDMATPALSIWLVRPREELCPWSKVCLPQLQFQHLWRSSGMHLQACVPTLQTRSQDARGSIRRQCMATLPSLIRGGRGKARPVSSSGELVHSYLVITDCRADMRRVRLLARCRNVVTPVCV